jgi:hypothetical protein
VLFLKQASLNNSGVPRNVQKSSSFAFDTEKQPQVEMIGGVGSGAFKSFDRGLTTTASPQKEDILTGSVGPCMVSGCCRAGHSRQKSLMIVRKDSGVPPKANSMILPNSASPPRWSPARRIGVPVYFGIRNGVGPGAGGYAFAKLHLLHRTHWMAAMRLLGSYHLDKFGVNSKRGK